MQFCKSNIIDMWMYVFLSVMLVERKCKKMYQKSGNTHVVEH